MYINEVKRDKETLKKISEFQCSIENLVSRDPYTVHTVAAADSGGRISPRPLQPTCVNYALKSSMSRTEEMDVLLTTQPGPQTVVTRGRMLRLACGPPVFCQSPCLQDGQWTGFGLGVGQQSSQPES